MSVQPPIVAVVGPTGTGKSDLAIALALELGGEVINADALQFYRGMDIGTAKIPPEERRGVPHHLLDILDIREEASVAAYQAEARQAIDAVRARGRVPVLVGGSGLYVRAVLDRLEFPGTDPALRERLEAELAAGGSAALRVRLAAVDPVSAARIADDRRLVRALEVAELTGRPFSSFMPDRQYYAPAVQIGLAVNPDELQTRLAERVHTMVRSGLLEEVRSLDARGLRDGRTASRALGYSQFLSVLDGTLSESAAIEDTVTATRQFAKRQRTWFRGDPRVQWLPWRAPDLIDRALLLARGSGPLS
ncbi:tRNA (adenosine(37)-N6)-dimethylallyltransferase MiaA [Arthrobacter crusticola]|uniref:tRNA (adenosine(37)-N6)-dimethylallyltransferase MiaA n=1 Tax=Arthrobacter crusticola TaxID=2547960 RepID=UPI001FE8AD00|nr:tRNA (adenosine(37)-N6)-dimethylallyltransferase MiaA [Arthrobacter crusticola]